MDELCCLQRVITEVYKVTKVTYIMAKEIKFPMEKETEELNIEIISSVRSKGGEIMDSSRDVSEWDYYSIIERHDSKGIIACWNEGESLEEVYVYIVRFKE